ncbi:MAG: hypothetical protein AAFV33_27105, partial [Chloroflexota bacterium]
MWRDTGILLAGLVLCTGLWLFQRGAPPPQPAPDPFANFVTGQPLPMRQLTVLPADEKEPVWSPDGSRIVFVGHANGNPDIYTVDAETGVVALHAPYDGDDHSPQWLDNDTLQFTRRPGEYTMNLSVQNTSVQPIYAPPLAVQQASFYRNRWQYSSRGQHALFPFADRGSRADRALLINPQTGEQQTIFGYQDPLPINEYTDADKNYFALASWSPDDTSVVFTYRIDNDDNYSGERMYRYYLLTDELTLIAEYPGERGSISNILWLGETEIMYTRSTYNSDYTEYRQDVHRHNLTTGETEITNYFGSAGARFNVAPTSDFLYQQVSIPACVAQQDCTQFTVQNLKTGSNIERTINHSVRSAEFSPDAESPMLAFSTFAGVYLMDVETGVWDNVIYGRHVRHISWSPDGRYLVARVDSPPGVQSRF